MRVDSSALRITKTSSAVLFDGRVISKWLKVKSVKGQLKKFLIYSHQTSIHLSANSSIGT